MKSLPDRQKAVPPESWGEIYAQNGVDLSAQDEADITGRLTSFLDLLNAWNVSQ